jgi:hypothetical protein
MIACDRMTAVRERADLLTLALALAIVPLTWWLLFGWSWSRDIAGHDELASLHNLLSIREIAETGEGWQALVYRADALGGFKGRDTVGPFPLFSLFATIGLTPTAIVVWSAFTVQALLAFLGCRAVVDLSMVSGGAPRALTPIGRIGAISVAGFAPVLAWRLSFGHLNLVVGLLPFAAALALLAAAAARTSTMTLAAVGATAFVLGLLHAGQQLVVYGAVFGAPIIIGLWWSLRGEWRRLAPPALITVGAFLVALPAFWSVLAHARSSDAPRLLGTATVTYDFVTSTLGDWLTSLPWTRALSSPGRVASLHHEVNYPVGPLVPLLALLPWRRARALAIGLALAVVAVLVFSMDLAPGSRALLALIPPLRSFRVPARAALPVLWALSILSVAALVGYSGARVLLPPPAPRSTRRRQDRGERQSFAGSAWRDHLGWLGIPVAITLFLAPPALRDVVVLALVASTVVVLRRGGALPIAMLVLVLGVASVGGFRERLLPFPEPLRYFAEADTLGGAVRRIKPDLDSTLNRVRLDLEIPVFTVNSAYAARLSSLDGYGTPTRRFSQLVFALRSDRYEPTAIFFKLPAGDPAFAVLRQLYNVGWNVTRPAPGQLALSPLGPTAGSAWFSASTVRLENLAAVARELRGAGETLGRRTKEVLWIDDSDLLAARADVPATIDERCREARILAVDAPHRGHAIVATISTDATCPFTFATNFTEDLRVTVVLASGRRAALNPFPGYGALTSVIAPAMATEIRLQAEPPRLPLAIGWVALGLACWGAAGWLITRER